MDWNLYTKLVDEISKEGGQSIKLQWRGEPTLDILLVNRVQYAKNSGILEVMFNSNAFLLTEKLIGKLIDAGLDKIIISVDGVSKEIYEKIRVNGSYEKLLGNLKLLKEMSKGTHLKVRIQGVLMRENKDDMKNFKEHWQPFADELFLRTMYNPLSALDQGDTPPGRRCPQTWQRLTIGYDGIAHPCCAPWESGLIVGNALRATLKEIWHGETVSGDIPESIRKNYININDLRKRHRFNSAHTVEECQKCGLYDVRPESRKIWDSYSRYRIV